MAPTATWSIPPVFQLASPGNLLLFRDCFNFKGATRVLPQVLGLWLSIRLLYCGIYNNSNRKAFWDLVQGPFTGGTLECCFMGFSFVCERFCQLGAVVLCLTLSPCFLPCRHHLQKGEWLSGLSTSFFKS